MRGAKMAAVLGLGLLLAVPLAAQLTEDDGLLPVSEEQPAETVNTTDDGGGDQPAEPQVATETAAKSDTAAGELESASAADKGASGKMEQLPKTASPLALLALIGAGGLGTGAVLRSRRRS